MRKWALWIGGGVALFVVLGAVNGIARRANENPPPSEPTANADTAINEREPTVFTYFFYWYDAETGGHLQPESGQPVTLPPDPPPTWRSTEWFRRQLEDMAEAGIDVVLPVYWGDGEEWSTGGLPNLAAAKAEIESSGGSAPAIGLFFDTTILSGRDLTRPADASYFYDKIKIFFDAIPRHQWALIDGRPVIWLYFSFFVNGFDQASFGYLYEAFERDYGVRPYIVREVSWDFTKIDGQTLTDLPIETDANYKWGAALEGYSERGSIAAVGPGFDEREIPGRGDAFRDREGGAWYRLNFEKAIASGKRFLVIETWNEVHEASGIQETLEFGRQYIELTRELVDRFKSGVR